jgi:hypothetical protein
MHGIVSDLAYLFYRIPIFFLGTRVASQESSESFDETLPGSIFFHSFFCVLRTRRSIATRGGKMGEGVLIDCNEKSKEFFHNYNYIISRTYFSELGKKNHVFSAKVGISWNDP